MIQKAPSSKTSFPPIANVDTEVLILGTLPGDRSLQLGEYFAHPRNRFWKIIASITGNPVPVTLPEKLDLLHKNKIGLWNVLYRADRKGSLDSDIQNEIPNDLPSFIARYKNLKVIGFDGQKAAALYIKYFKKRSDLRYITLPSCSPANARCDLEALCTKWTELLGPA